MTVKGIKNNSISYKIEIIGLLRHDKNYTPFKIKIQNMIILLSQVSISVQLVLCLFTYPQKYVSVCVHCAHTCIVMHEQNNLALF